MNCEHVSVPDHKYWLVDGKPDLRVSNLVAPRRWWVYGSDKLLDISMKAYQTFNVGLVGDMDPRSSGEMGIMARDLPTIQVIRSPVTKHTDQDIARMGAGGRPRTGRARLRQDHRRSEQARPARHPRAGADDVEPGPPVSAVTAGFIHGESDHHDDTRHRPQQRLKWMGLALLFVVGTTGTTTGQQASRPRRRNASRCSIRAATSRRTSTSSRTCRTPRRRTRGLTASR